MATNPIQSVFRMDTDPPPPVFYYCGTCKGTAIWNGAPCAVCDRRGIVHYETPLGIVPPNEAKAGRSRFASVPPEQRIAETNAFYQHRKKIVVAVLILIVIAVAIIEPLVAKNRAAKEGKTTNAGTESRSTRRHSE